VNAYRGAPRCPRDKHPLEVLGTGTGMVWGCAGCAGVLLDDEAFGFVRSSFYEKIAKSARVPMDLVPWDPSPALACPMCGDPMVRTELCGVAVDFCKEHGTWFDARELVAVAYALVKKTEEDRGGARDQGFRPWAPSPETAAEMATLNERLRQAVNGAVLTDAVRRLRKPFWEP